MAFHRSTQYSTNLENVIYRALYRSLRQSYKIVRTRHAAGISVGEVSCQIIPKCRSAASHLQPRMIDERRLYVLCAVPYCLKASKYPPLLPCPVHVTKKRISLRLLRSRIALGLRRRTRSLKNAFRPFTIFPLYFHHGCLPSRHSRMFLRC